MIKAIEGIITQKEPTFVVIKTANGISFGVFVSLWTSNLIKIGEKTELLITQILREDANLLYGFSQNSEQKMFEMLIKLSGIGPTSAMAICSSLSASNFTKAIANGDVNAFKQVPGIGIKTAKRIIVELSDAKLMLDETNSVANQAILALESLGFKRDKIIKALKDCVANDTATLVKEALKKLN